MKVDDVIADVAIFFGFVLLRMLIVLVLINTVLLVEYESKKQI